jgi:hypothetical protein
VRIARSEEGCADEYAAGFVNDGRNFNFSLFWVLQMYESAPSRSQEPSKVKDSDDQFVN